MWDLVSDRREVDGKVLVRTQLARKVVMNIDNQEL